MVRVYKLKPMVFLSGDCRGQKLIQTCWRSTCPAESLICVPVRFNDCLNNHLSINDCSNQTGSIFSPFDAITPSIMIDAGYLVVDSLRCSETLFPNVTTRSICLLKAVSTVTVLSSENNVNRFLQVIQKRVLLSRRF